ncbi:MAG: molecular chaperone GrpE [Blastocatellia bacterium]|jgi:molecular chaperone GrpE (heat shock protein)|nr:molecular chaperone GrpE [Blastocatellia bacterium]
MSVDETSTGLAEQNEPEGEQPPASEITPTNSVVSEEPTDVPSVEQVVTAEVVPNQQVEAATDQHNEGIQILSQRVEQLAALLEEANVLSSDRERIIDRLHQENQQLRAGEISQAVAPLFRDLIRLYDDLKQTGKRFEERADADMKEISRDFKSFCDAVEDVLYRHGVERYEALEGSPFNSKEQKALGVVPTQNAGFDRAIARVVRVGFRTDTKIIRILEAEVFRFTRGAALDEATDNEKAVSADQPTEETGK